MARRRPTERANATPTLCCCTSASSLGRTFFVRPSICFRTALSGGKYSRRCFKACSRVRHQTRYSKRSSTYKSSRHIQTTASMLSRCSRRWCSLRWFGLRWYSSQLSESLILRRASLCPSSTHRRVLRTGRRVATPVAPFWTKRSSGVAVSRRLARGPSTQGATFDSTQRTQGARSLSLELGFLKRACGWNGRVWMQRDRLAPRHGQPT